MKLLSALFDLTLLPVAVVKDLFTGLDRIGIQGRDSYTRQQIEKVEEDLER